MKHHKKGRIFGLPKNKREALLRSLALSLVLHGRIQTTEAKAKELRPFVEHLVTFGKKKTLAARRIVRARLGSESGATKIFTEVAKKYENRPGGYTRIIKLPPRLKDASSQAIIEFL